MLSGEAAQQQLKEWVEEKDAGEQKLAVRIRELPQKLRGIAWAFFDRQADGTEWPKTDDRDAIRARRAQRHEPLDKLSSKDRVQVWKTFLPKLGQELEVLYQHLKSVPYQGQYSSKPFRLPDQPEVTQAKRYSLLEEFAQFATYWKVEQVDLLWLATWVPYFSYQQTGDVSSAGRLFAAVLSHDHAQANELEQLLIDSANNAHPVGMMGRHVVLGLLGSNRPTAWKFIEKLLLAAQRQEGLRQVILSSLDESHPQAFMQILRVIIDEQLVRFSAVAQAMNSWLGYAWDSQSVKVINGTLEKLSHLLENADARQEALRGNDAETAYLALWSTALFDAQASIEPTLALLRHKKPEFRWAALLHAINLNYAAAGQCLLLAAEDTELVIAAHACLGLDENELFPAPAAKVDRRFELAEQVIARCPDKPLTKTAWIWPWSQIKIDRESLIRVLVEVRGERPVTGLLPYISMTSGWQKRGILESIVAQKEWNAATSEAVLKLCGDASADVRGVALNAINKRPATPEITAHLQGLLTRKSNDVRMAVLSNFLKREDDEVLKLADQLLDCGDALQRLAGLELLNEMHKAKRTLPRVIERAQQYQTERKKRSAAEETLLETLVSEPTETLTLANALGLCDLSQRTPVVPPRKIPFQYVTPTAEAILQALDALVHEHREDSFTVKSYNGTEETHILGSSRGWDLPHFDRDKSLAVNLQENPVTQPWFEWEKARKKSLRDKDGLELYRAELWREMQDGYSAYLDIDYLTAQKPELDALRKELIGELKPSQLRYPGIVERILQWLLAASAPSAVQLIDQRLDAIESFYSRIPDKLQQMLVSQIDPAKENSWHRDEEEIEQAYDWRATKAVDLVADMIPLGLPKTDYTVAQFHRFWQLLCWFDEPARGCYRRRPNIDYFLLAYERQLLNNADVFDYLLGPMSADETRYARSDFSGLALITSHGAPKILAQCPGLLEIGAQIRTRVLEIELARGETPTLVTPAAQQFSSIPGADYLLRLLTLLGKDGFKQVSRWGSGGETKPAVFTHLVQATFPLENETPELVAKQLKAAIKAKQFPEERLLQLVFLAPQWIKHLEAYFNWPGFSEGVIWFMAHMKSVSGAETVAEGVGFAADQAQDQEQEKQTQTPSDAPKPKRLSAWEKLVLERTALTDEERSQGAIDIAWFMNTHKALGTNRWEELAGAARYAASPSQAKKAKFLADVLMAKVKREDLVKGIRDKFLKDYVKLIGLLPLAKGAARDKDLLERYRVLQEYRKYARKLTMTREDALRACEIGMANLARTAGYVDPLRLEWAMEADAVRDLAKGPVTLTKSGVTITLELTDQAQPLLSVKRGEKELKSIPPDIKKQPDVAELTQRVPEIKRQSSRMKQSLEAAMCRGDSFSGTELQVLAGHAILAPLIQRLVLVGEGIMGYPDKGGKVLRDFAGKLEPIKKNEVLRLAHPCDFHESKQWPEWQHECFQAERVQPFKQIFRELYLLTEQEKKDKTSSSRYAGQQVNPTQANALWSQRGWETRDGIWKTFHQLGITAELSINYGWTTPLEVEGYTLDQISFRRTNEYKPLPLTEIPARVFSEVMRDMDLVVSVAHRGGVDPEASASTVEMRETLLRETCELLGLRNVRFKSPHVLIKGHLSEYNIHLGSGVVHRLPGGYLCIVPVHSQHRGRLFLPFADDDPRTAEVISKTLLLARDHEIQDPIILEQLRV